MENEFMSEMIRRCKSKIEDEITKCGKENQIASKKIDFSKLQVTHNMYTPACSALAPVLTEDDYYFLKDRYNKLQEFVMYLAKQPYRENNEALNGVLFNAELILDEIGDMK